MLAELPHLTPAQVQDAVLFLQENGNVYTTSDEFHFRAAQ